ncbi:MAG TPA: STAS/SEC14 domain-containing protein [Burkholderiales bacterium]|nr:STAS/SEC14 domain-containing protein [Burkholderiales bacterium]
MISIQHAGNLITANVLGEFTLADYREFEQHVLEKLRRGKKVNLLFDLRDMVSYTVDVAWEDIRFSRRHEHDFGKIAIITSNQWLTWTAWLSRLFVHSDIQVFEDDQSAQDWLKAAS